MWYRQQCNGRWEHHQGMLLEPGENSWTLSIDLRGTDAAGAAPRRMAVCAIDGAWLRCTLTPQRFEGRGAEVEQLIGVFRRWIDARPPIFEAASAF